VGWNIGFIPGHDATGDLSDDCDGALLRIYQPGEKQAELERNKRSQVGARRELKAALPHFIFGARRADQRVAS
jgi:hypothetical protein